MPVGNKGPLSLEFDTLFMPIVEIPQSTFLMQSYIVNTVWYRIGGTSKL